MEHLFQDRREAGHRLAQVLAERGYGGDGLVVLGIPRGGLVVAGEVARVLGASLDLVVARKLRAPSHQEVAIGAVTSGDPQPLVDEELARVMGATPEYLKTEIEHGAPPSIQ